jgi:hypothetical protein
VSDVGKLRGKEPIEGGDLLRWLLSKPPGDAGNAVRQLHSARLQDVMGLVLSAQQTQRKENQLAFYTPVSDKAASIHTSTAKVIGAGGGNRSGKSETCLAEIASCATGVFSPWMREHCDIKAKFRGPISARVVVESLTTTLHPTILPKLQWWHWSGTSEPGGKMGHWGWIPRNHLIAGSWNRSWSEKLRTLTILCRDPETGQVKGNSKIQFMSRDQDPSDFASGEFHIVMHDEPPTAAIWRENQARTISVNGRMMLAMTWPDDPSIPVDWIYDEVYYRAMQKQEGYFWTELWSQDNPHIDQAALEFQKNSWSQKTIEVRMFGRPIRFSSRVHPLFTDEDDQWCYTCGDGCVIEERKCGKCGSSNVVVFNHVTDFTPNPSWPTLWLVDPHPRKPHMYQWWQIDPQDDLWLVADGECDGGVATTRDEVMEVERELGLSVVRRLIDPNMGRSPASARNRNVTWQDEFDAVGLQTDLADDSEAGRGRVNEYLTPDAHTLAPRIHIHPRCAKTIFQMKRYIWDDYKEKQERDQKQTPKTKNDDFPTLMKYLLNSDPQFRTVMDAGMIVRRNRTPRRTVEKVWASA